MTDRRVSLSLDKGDVSKLDILKKRFMFSEDIDVIRYLLTEAVEKVAEEIVQMEKSSDRDKRFPHVKAAEAAATAVYS